MDKIEGKTRHILRWTKMKEKPVAFQHDPHKPKRDWLPRIPVTN